MTEMPETADAPGTTEPTASGEPPGTAPVPTVSVAMINRDYGRYLAEAIDSALAQEPRPLEVVVVDDGSTDSSAAVLASYGDAVTSIVTPARGKGAATNEAVAACRGDVVALLDSDDLMLPGRLRALGRAYAADARAQWVWHRLAHVQRDTREPLGGAGLRGFTPGRHDHRAAVARGRLPITTPATSALSWRRTFLTSLLPLPARVRSQDNYLKFLTLGLAPGVVVDEVLSLQGLHGDNAYTTAQGRDRAAKQVLRAIDVAAGLHRHGLDALHRRTVAEALVNSMATTTLAAPDRRAVLEQARVAGPRLAPWLLVAAARRTRQNATGR